MIPIALCALLGLGHAATAQVKDDIKKAGNKTAEVASKAASKVADQELKDKEGPGGQTIYVNGHNQYYWIDKKGHKKYVSANDLRPKTK